MMGSTVTISGNATKDATFSQFANGNGVAKFSIAVSEPKPKENQQQQQPREPTYIDVKVFGRDAQWVAQCVKKGQEWAAHGFLVREVWDGQQGRREQFFVHVWGWPNQFVAPICRTPRQQQQNFPGTDAQGQGQQGQWQEQPQDQYAPAPQQYAPAQQAPQPQYGGYAPAPQQYAQAPAPAYSTPQQAPQVPGYVPPNGYRHPAPQGAPAQQGSSFSGV